MCCALNASFIEFNTACSLVLVTSCNLNPRFLLRLHDLSVLQSFIIFNAKSLRINLLFDCFIGPYINSYLCFLYSSSYLFVTAGQFLCPNCCSTCLSFSRNVLRLCYYFFISLVILTILYIHKKKIFLFSISLMLYTLNMFNIFAVRILFKIL